MGVANEVYFTISATTFAAVRSDTEELAGTHTVLTSLSMAFEGNGAISLGALQKVISHRSVTSGFSGTGQKPSAEVRGEIGNSWRHG